MSLSESRAIAVCPPWCTVRHGVHPGEDELVHVGEPVALTGAVLARLCMSMTPEGEVDDGPYVLVGADELTLDEAHNLGQTLIAMAEQGQQVTRPATT